MGFTLQVTQLFCPKCDRLRRQIGFQIPVQRGRRGLQNVNLAAAFEELRVGIRAGNHSEPYSGLLSAGNFFITRAAWEVCSASRWDLVRS